MYHILVRFNALLIVLASFNSLYAQSSAMPYLNLPRGIYSYSIGKQGVTSRDPVDAMLYNPANLVFAAKPQLTFNRQPAFIPNTWFSSLSASMDVPETGYFGFEYTNYDLGEFVQTSDQGPQVIATFHSYEQAFSLAYARKFSNAFSAGIQFRYALDHFPSIGTASSSGIANYPAYLFSGGVRYDPVALRDRFSFGYALTNFGTTITYGDPSQADPPPAQMNLGISGDAIKNEFITMTLSIAASKPVNYRAWNPATQTHEAESSFKAFFDDWQHTPDDIDFHSGLSFSWNPISLGNGFSYFQSMYLGEISGGSYYGLADQFTHGAEIGLSWNDIQLALGYAGTWHYVNQEDAASFRAFMSLPQEDVQLSLSAPLSSFQREKNTSIQPPKLSRIILSAGVTRMIRFGHFHTSESYGAGQYFPNTYGYGIEAAFYVTKTSALVSSFSYTQMDDEVYYLGNNGKRYTNFTAQIDNLSFASSYRNYPLTAFFPFFYEVGLGITRWESRKEKMIPKYYYKTFACGGIGALVKIINNVELIPKVGFQSTLMPVTGNAPRIGGYNQWNFSLNAGYSFE